MDISEVKKRARRRKEDYEMPAYLPFLPGVLWLISAALFLGVFVLGLGIIQHGAPTFPFQGPGFYPGMAIGIPIVIITGVLIGIVGLILGIYVLYKWLERRNEHFERVILFYKDVLDFLADKGAEEEARRAKRTLREMESESSEKPTVLWIVLSIVFQPVLLYVFHFLTRDYYDHEKWENLLFDDISDAIEAASGSFDFRGYDEVNDRNTILYIILTIVTFGIFGLYWIYAITVDPNNHFRESKRVEEELLLSLEEI